MGNCMTALMVIGIIVTAGMIWTAGWIVVCLYQENKRDAKLKCTCGKRSVLYWNEGDYGRKKAYAYMCDCGVKGLVGYDKEEALYGWVLRHNKDSYFAYIIAKNGGK